MVADICANETAWIGSPLENVFIPKLSNKEVTFYRKCIFGPLSIQIGDFVLVSNADSPDPDTISGCDVAKILHLYDIDDEMYEKDPCHAIVQWYSRPQNVPHKVFDDDNICIEFDTEIIEDHRPYDQDISIETIFRKCVVIEGELQDSATNLLKAIKKSVPMFVCRYKLLKVKNTYKLIPLNVIDDDNNASNNDVRTSLRQNSTTNGNNKIRNTPQKKTPKKSESSSSSSAKKSKNIEKSSSAKKLQEVEFVDVNAFEKQCTVSPIKIVKNTVVKMSRSSLIENGLEKELNANYLTESPGAKDSRNTTPLHKVSGARRNLNISLDKEMNSTTDSDIFNYSIIKDTNPQSTALNVTDMKIKLRLSEKQKQNRKELSSTITDTEDYNSTPKLRRRESQTVSTDSISEYQKLINRKHSVDGNYFENEQTPSKRIREICEEKTPSSKLDNGRRKSILKTPGSRSNVAESTPKRNIQLSNIIEEMIYEENSTVLSQSNNKRTPRVRIKKKNEDDDYDVVDPSYIAITPRKRRSSLCKSQQEHYPEQMDFTPSKRGRLKADTLTPTIDNRQQNRKLQNVITSRKCDNTLSLLRERLHVSAIPDSLPCREIEFQNIYTFLEGKIQDKCGGCMYVSGVPGTGKTATVTGVIRCLQKEAQKEEIPEFDFIEINGMKLSEPRQAYVQIYKQLTGKTVSWEHAQSLLEKRFTTPAPRRTTTVLLVDELDILCNRRQDVVYNLLDWPTKAPAKLVVITIANTMDLPERLLMGKVTSRLGLTRLTFQPYSHKQLQEIVSARLGEFTGFKDDAVQLVARKVAAVSGDARRALDICRRATEIAEESISTGSSSAVNDKGAIINMAHVSQALAEMIASPKVQAIKSCSKLQQIFLQAVSAEVTRTGVEEIIFMGVYQQLESITAFMGMRTPTPGQALQICSKLGAERLLICEHSRTDLYQKILLNVSTDDIHYALQVQVN